METFTEMWPCTPINSHLLNRYNQAVWNFDERLTIVERFSAVFILPIALPICPILISYYVGFILVSEQDFINAKNWNCYNVTLWCEFVLCHGGFLEAKGLLRQVRFDLSTSTRPSVKRSTPFIGLGGSCNCFSIVLGMGSVSLSSIDRVCCTAELFWQKPLWRNFF